MPFHFDCVFYYVSEMERAIHFYRDVLGLRFVARDVVARFDIDGVLFELVPATEANRRVRGTRSCACRSRTCRGFGRRASPPVHPRGKAQAFSPSCTILMATKSASGSIPPSARSHAMK
jgi:catechol 2,3-dioxygenase-like lactoylglutathione lyase family enzyme